MMFGVYKSRPFPLQPLAFINHLRFFVLCFFMALKGQASHYALEKDLSLQGLEGESSCTTYRLRPFDPESGQEIMPMALLSTTPVEQAMFIPPRYPHMCALLSFLDLHGVPIHPIAFHQSHGMVQAFEWIDVVTDESNTFLGSTMTSSTKLTKKLHKPLMQLTIRNEAVAKGCLDILRLRKDLLRHKNQASMWCLLKKVGITREMHSFGQIVSETP